MQALILSSLLLVGELRDLSWMTGSWASADSRAEETWSTAPTVMLGMFRLLDKDEIKFCELMTIQREGAEIFLRIRHFDKLLTPSETSPVVFVLRKATNKEAVFENLGDDPVRKIIYSLDGTTLKIKLDRIKDPPREFVFKKK
jgi:hypothetical protein